MIGNILFLATAAAVCNAGLIPISNTWPAPTTCSRTSSFLPNSGSLDYNQLLHVLYPEVQQDPIDDISMSLINGYSQMGTGYEINDFPRISPGIRGSNRVILPSREVGFGPMRVGGRSKNYEDCRGCGECRGCDECRNCGEMRGNCECDEGRDNCECRGCGERCMNDCCECRNCCQQRNSCECRGCNQRSGECRNCCDSGECYSNCGCSKSTGSSRSGSNYNRCGSSGCGNQRNMQCSPCRCMKMQGQCCCNSKCC